jgi:mannose-1-phosphate guanylyltransferase/mannose-6-phosphate isomerase
MSAHSVIHPVILCGGSGTRLWPLSRKSFPKQFAKLMGQESLFQASARRSVGVGFAAPLVVTGDSFRFIVIEQLAAIEMSPAGVLIEPDARNTAPAILAATLHRAKTDPNSLLLVLPSDQIVPDIAAFQKAVQAAVPAATAGNIVTFGIVPTRPETGYGYLELAATAQPDDATHPLQRFVEKPDSDTALAMVTSGKYLWNAGIFLFSATTLIAAYRAHAPDILDAVSAAVDGAQSDIGFTRLEPQAWARAPSVSVDFDILEISTNLAVMPFSAGWSDLGSWDAVLQESGPDANGNVISDHATAIDCTGSLLRSEAGGLELVGIGLNDIIAIAMPDAVLVAKRSDSQRVKEAVTALEARQAKQATAFFSDHRPWGSFESIAMGSRFQVKRIVVKPGGKLSLQSHVHRAEHWIVVQGTARVTVDDDVRLLSENQSIYIPLAAIHRLENPGRMPMVLIEVQTGSYLGEDDIVRYEDLYART